MYKLFSMPLLLGLAAFFIGWLTAKFSSYVASRAAALEVPDHHRTIRALEANLRVVKKDAQIAVENLAESTQQLESLQASLNDMEQTSQFKEEELKQMHEAVQGETKKVVELRRTLQERAEETIRAKLIARESETELCVLKAGASVMHDEVDRLEAEREELTDRLKALDQEIIKAFDADQMTQEDVQADQSISDC